MNSKEAYTVPLRKLAGLVFAVGLALSWVLTLFGLVADHYLFTPDPYLDALERFRFAQLFPRLLAEQIVQAEPPSDPFTEPPGQIARPANQIKYLNVDDYEIILSGLMPEDWIRAETRSVVTQSFEILNLDARRHGLSVSLVGVKDQLSGPPGDEIATRMIRSWPPCSLEWIGQVAALAASQAGLQGFPTCQPPEEFFELIRPVVRGSLNELVGSLPDQVDLVQALRDARAGALRFDQMPPAGEGSAGFDLPFSYRLFRWALRLSPVITAWMLAMVALFAVRSWRDLVVWWGIPALVAGIVSLLLSLVAGLPIYSAVSTRLLSAAQGTLTNNLMHLFLLTIQTVLQRYLLWVSIFAGVLALVSAGALIVSQILQSRRDFPAS